jgi:hypothetical protein
VLLEGGHAKRISEPFVWSRREIWTAIVAAVVVLATVGVGIFALVGHSDDPSCISAPAATSTGGASLHACGATARAWCRDPLAAAGGGARVADAIRAACREKAN